MTFLLRVIACWVVNAGHDYSEWRAKGSKGRPGMYRICRRCNWVQLSEGTNEG